MFGDPHSFDFLSISLFANSVSSKIVPFELILRDEEVSAAYIADKMCRQNAWGEMTSVWFQYEQLGVILESKKMKFPRAQYDPKITQK